MNLINLKTPVADLFMVGKTYAQRLKKLDINTVEDLLHHYPFRYNDFSLISKISSLQQGEIVTIQGEIVDCKNIYTKSHKQIQKALIKDESGQIQVNWFNQPYLVQILKPGVKISLSGKVAVFSFKPALISPEYEIIRSSNFNSIHTGRLVPVYPETYGVSSKWLRSRIAPLLKTFSLEIADWLPEKIKKENQLIDLCSAIQQIHFPNNQAEVEQAKKRLSFDELFLLQLSALKRKKEWQKQKSTQAIKINKLKISQFIQQLPFSLTLDQKKASRQILQDLKKNKPMNRLLEGDVGSGKTVVAAIALYAVFLNGLKSILMAPTEILANQHYQTINNLLKPFGVKTALLTGSQKLKMKTANFDILIGTHALIYHQLIKQVGLIVIDEQHRFGVEQRAKLVNQNQTPHLLTMTATPIPRTIALTLYSDLDLSVLKEMPLGRKKIKTWVVPPKKRMAAYQWIKKQIKNNHIQAFIVCPLIEESTKESMKDIKAATAEFERLTKKIFPSLKLGLLHGRMKDKDKEKIINKFKEHKFDILVSTPVIEVGIDIPNAAIIIIEGANRFGLAQLHQLRGRVGRSHHQSYCLLFSPETSLKRLQALEQNNSGFELAEIDLQLRGPGEIYGIKQHGFTKLKIASFNQTNLIQKTKKISRQLIEKLDEIPLLKEKLESYTIKSINPN